MKKMLTIHSGRRCAAALPVLLAFALVPNLFPAAPGLVEAVKAVKAGFVVRVIVPGEFTDPEQIKDLGNAAIQELASRFVEERGGGDLVRFAILPLQEDFDGGYFTVQLENAFARQGREGGYEFFTRTDADVATLLGELKWSEDFRDAMDPATVQEFGRLKGVEGVIFTRLDLGRRINGAATIRVNAQVNEVETGQRLWGYEARGDGFPYLFVVVVSIPVLLAVWLLNRVRRKLRAAGRPR